MPDVFLSYVTEDRDIADRISRGLEDAGLSVWWDRHLEGGAEFGPEIERQLDDFNGDALVYGASFFASAVETRLRRRRDAGVIGKREPRGGTPDADNRKAADQ